MGSVFGKVFTISTWGESHGGGIGVVLDGCPANLPLSEADIQAELDRRRPGQSKITTQRKESDEVRIVSGVYEGRTLGTPIAMLIPNKDAMPQAYAEMREKYRPSHADYTYQMKYGHRNPEGGGRSSARETAGRVAAGAVAKKLLSLASQVEMSAYVSAIHEIEAPAELPFPTLQEVEANPVRCPDPEAAAAMEARIAEARDRGNSVGGIITCRVRGLPVGLGEPIFDRLEAELAKAMLSLPATKGFEVGSGFAGTRLTGAEHNDIFRSEGGQIRTSTNRSGGVQGGITNGEELYFRVAFKPTATILTKQDTVDTSGQQISLKARGRHDPCVVPRAVPIVEAMA
ncbi:MAG: chorismate synthase, partial [Verrucomicrobiota bacterium]